MNYSYSACLVWIHFEHSLYDVWIGVYGRVKKEVVATAFLKYWALHPVFNKLTLISLQTIFISERWGAHQDANSQLSLHDLLHR